MDRYFVHSTHPRNICSIFRTGKLYSINRLTKEGFVAEPSAAYESDIRERDYVELCEPWNELGELVVNSRNGLDSFVLARYQPSVRFFFDAAELKDLPNARVEKQINRIDIRDELELTEDNLLAVVFPSLSSFYAIECIENEDLREHILKNKVVIPDGFALDFRAYLKISNALIQENGITLEEELQLA